MKIICETKRKIDTTTSCRKEYCCKELKNAMEYFDDIDHTTMYTNFSINDKTDDVELTTHSGYDGASKCAKVSFCPFCGSPLYVERETVDNTDKLPESPPNIVIHDEPKKIPWWRFW